MTVEAPLGVPLKDWPELVDALQAGNGLALVLRYDGRLASDARDAMLAYRKAHGELPEYDRVAFHASVQA